MAGPVHDQTVHDPTQRLIALDGSVHVNRKMALVYLRRLAGCHGPDFIFPIPYGGGFVLIFVRKPFGF